jgi:hypothetical protein
LAGGILVIRKTAEQPGFLLDFWDEMDPDSKPANAASGNSQLSWVDQFGDAEILAASKRGFLQ